MISRANIAKRMRQTFCVAVALAFVPWISATEPRLTVAALKQDAALTPESLLRQFRDFRFELRDKVQEPAVFLKRQAGDCDDFATFASDLLTEKGFSTKLVVVFMAKEIHVVCYVAEANAYLDFNNRGNASPLVPTDGTVSDIAEKVARSFESEWHCASEFTYNNGQRHFVYTDFRQADPPAASVAATVVSAATQSQPATP